MPGFSADYYSACAQIIPVFFVVVAVEFRLFLDPRELSAESVNAVSTRPWQTALAVAGIVGFVLTTVLGEGAALRSLKVVASSDGRDDLILGTLLAQASLLILVPLLDKIYRLAVRRHRAAVAELNRLRSMTSRDARGEERAATVDARIRRRVLIRASYCLVAMTVASCFAVPVYACGLVLCQFVWRL